MKADFSVVLAGVMALSCVPAVAQTAPGPPGTSQVIPEKKQKPLDEQKGDVDSGRSSTLSDKLDSSNGVIKPSGDVDPGISKTPPEHPNTMPVIPPAGSPGGARGVVPK